MSIPNAKEPVPPALPPPKRIDGLDDGAGSGVDLGWWLGNSKQGPLGGRSSFGSIDPHSSLFGGRAHHDAADEHNRMGPMRRGSSTSTIRATSGDEPVSPHRQLDEGYASLSGSSLTTQKSALIVPLNVAGHYPLTNACLAHDRLQGEESQSNAFLQRSVQAYDNSLLQKIDLARSDPASRNTNAPARNYQPPVFRGGVTPPSSSNVALEGRRNLGPLKPLSLSTGPSSAVGSPQRTWHDSPDSAVSPRHPVSEPLSQGYLDYRNARRETGSLSSITPDRERSYLGHQNYARRAGSLSTVGSYEDASSFANRVHRDSYDPSLATEPDPEFPMEETGLKHLNLGDRSPPRRDDYSPHSKTGQKRRASSPPREPDGPLSAGSSSTASEFSHRQPLTHRSAERKSSVPRLNNGSVSSTSSLPRSASLVSSAGMSLAASSTTSMSSFDRLSPRGTSPLSELDPTQDTAYTPTTSLRPSPRNSLSRPHQRNSSEAKTAPTSRRPSADDPGPTTHHSSSAFYICECCPKKPKKFENLAELRTHEMEKQYTCQYCHNRFKNKNEAERHQNSLHLRRHSWSCNALSGVEAAFHASPRKPSAVDVCGYCGDEFPNPANWDVRVEHLTTVHKFGECNQGKKFFRADHFRQHLKHSHAGTSGKWTNMLENACMKDEPLPERMGSVSEGVGRIDEEREEA
ncbi:MAG: hypothetical protein M1838_001769 [Thelocarpon superellum]|nr:MAG: hypothetical protein M1838_001769 [Thelocarpon superellum]